MNSGLDMSRYIVPNFSVQEPTDLSGVLIDEPYISFSVVAHAGTAIHGWQRFS